MCVCVCVCVCVHARIYAYEYKCTFTFRLLQNGVTKTTWEIILRANKPFSESTDI